MKNKKADEAVTAIVATALLLAMAIVLFSVLNYIVFAFQFQPTAPSVNLVGAIKGDKVIIEHNGGESLPLDTILILTIDDSIESKSIGWWGFADTDGNNRWNIGEKLAIDPGNIYGKHVAAMVVDAETNSIIMMGVLQS